MPLKKGKTSSSVGLVKFFKRLVYLFIHALDFLYSIYINLRTFPLKTAIKCPIMLHHAVDIKGLVKGCIKIESDNIRPLMIQIGFEGTEGVSNYRKSCLVIGKDASLIFKGKASLTRGVSIRSQKGTIIFGQNFYSNCNMSIICAKEVVFGNDVLLGWDISLRDCDGHKVYVDGMLSQGVKPVRIGDHVWMGAHVDILKGVTIPSGSIVAYRSCVLHPFEEENILIGGYPAKQLRSNVRWED